MWNIIKKTWIPITIIGTFLSAFLLLNLLPDASFSVVQQKNMLIGTYNFRYYQIDIHTYLKNIENAFTGKSSIVFMGDLVIPTTPKTPNWTNVSQVYRYIVNIMIFIVNWLILLLNILITPIKLLLYPASIILALLGLNTSTASYIQAITLLESFNINYIIYL